MKILDKINTTLHSIQAYAGGTIPVGGKLFQTKSTEFSGNLSEKYEDIEKLLTDEKIYSLVALIASLVQYSYKGPHLQPVNKYEDDELTPNESKVLNLADKFADSINGLDYSQLMFDIAWNIILHGEEIFIYKFGKEKQIVALQPVALNASYFVERKDQINNKETTVYSDEILVVKKDGTDNNPDTYDREQFEHISYHRRSVWRKDIEGRTTFNVYSIVPAKCLQNLHKWKLKTMENDVIWKNKLLPRIKHTLDMGGINAAQYPGKTQSEKTAAALRDANKIIENFKNETKIDTPDEDLISSESVTTEMLESRSTNYQDPNKTLDQINDSFNTPFGVPNGQTGGNSGASMGVELDSIFESIRVDVIAKAIAKALGKAVRKQLIINDPGLVDEINRIYIHVDTMLPVHKFTLARTVLALAKSGTVLKTESREMVGLPRLPQMKDELFISSKDNSRDSEEQGEKDLLQESAGKNSNNDSPRAKENTSESRNTA